MSKASKKRSCPAVGHEISSGECGANRVSRYDCPADCPYLPFAPANYSQLLELEGRVDNESMGWLIKDATDRPAMERALQKARYNPSSHALHAFFEWNLFFTCDQNGRTCAERLEQSTTSGFKNDERVLLRAKMQTRVALLEIHRVLDTEQIEAVDLFTPDAPALLLHDRSLASVAVRFATALAWIYPLPHYWRLSGTAALMPDLDEFKPREIVTEIVSHLGGPVTEAEMRVWLAENFVRFDESLKATSRLRRMQMFAGMDARHGKAVYELQAPFAQCRDRLMESPNVEPDDLLADERDEGFAEACLWFATMPEARQAVPPGGRATLGRVLLGQSHWRLETFGGEKLAELRNQFEAQLGHLTRFTGERLDDLGARMAAKESPTDKSLVPPRLLENPGQILLTSSVMPALPPGASQEQTEADLFREAERQFLDDHIPALDNRTPREAASEPALRPRLIHLLKQRVRRHDERNLETGRNDDINWLLRELGADEILFDPPPLRPPSKPVLDDDLLEEDELFPGNPFLPPAPPLPKEPLNIEEASRRLEDGMAPFNTAADAMASLFSAGLTILDDAGDLTLDLLTEDEFGLVTVFILQAVLALVPPGHRPPPTSFESLELAFNFNMNELRQCVDKNEPEALSDYFKKCSQPHLMQLLALEILKTGMTGPKKFRPSMEAQPVIFALVKAVVEEMDRMLRP